MKPQTHTQRVAAARLQDIFGPIMVWPVIPEERPSLERPIAKIVRMVADEFEVEVSDILSVSRKIQHVMPRQTAIYLASEIAGQGLSQLGRRFGRDHSTIDNALKRTVKRMAKDPDFAALVWRLRWKLAGSVSRP